MRVIIKQGLAYLILSILPLVAFADIVMPKRGWYLISVNTFTQVSTLMAQYPHIQSIWGQDGNEWIVTYRNPPANNPYSSIPFLLPENGYWVLVNRATVMASSAGINKSNLLGYGFTDGAGWKLLGIPANISSLQFNSFFDDYLPPNGTVWVWKDNNWSIYTKGDSNDTNQFNASHNTQFGNLREINSNSGVWVNFGDVTTTTTSTTTTTTVTTSTSPTTTLNCRNPFFPPAAGDNRPPCPT